MRSTFHEYVLKLCADDMLPLLRSSLIVGVPLGCDQCHSVEFSCMIREIQYLLFLLLTTLGSTDASVKVDDVRSMDAYCVKACAAWQVYIKKKMRKP